MNDETIKLQLDLGGSSKDAQALSTSLHELEKSADKAGNEVEQLGKKGVNRPSRAGLRARRIRRYT